MGLSGARNVMLKANQTKAQILKDKRKAQKLVYEASELLKRIEAEPENKTQLARQARALVEEAIALDARNDNAWILKEDTKIYSRNRRSALDDYGNAIELNPRNDVAWHKRGWARYRLGVTHHGAKYHAGIRS